MIHKGCIIVPYRDREQHLAKFIPHMKNFIKQFNLNMHILVVEQTPGKPFNRAKLFNIGFQYLPTESTIPASDYFDYFVFHDVDMLPRPNMFAYTYPKFPTHIATKCSQFNFAMPVPDYFGGVTLINRQDFLKVNGFGNEFWGWGAEDCEFRQRFRKAGIKVVRRDCVFDCLDHERPVDWNKLRIAKQTKKELSPEFKQYERNIQLQIKCDYKNDGLSTCNWFPLSVKEYNQVTILTVDL